MQSGCLKMSNWEALCQRCRTVRRLTLQASSATNQPWGQCPTPPVDHLVPSVPVFKWPSQWRREKQPHWAPLQSLTPWVMTHVSREITLRAQVFPKTLRLLCWELWARQTRSWVFSLVGFKWKQDYRREWSPKKLLLRKEKEQKPRYALRRNK